MDQHLVRPNCCIYQVPDDVRRRRDVYTPLLFSIGPFHRGKVGLGPMEERKIRYYDKFHRRLGGGNLDGFKLFLQHNEPRIRNTYRYVNETCTLSSDEFQNMVLYDSVFIMELVLSYEEGECNVLLLRYQNADDGLLRKSLLKDAYIRRDLLLLENQLPYFILQELYRLISDITGFPAICGHPSLLLLSCKLLHISLPKEILSMTKEGQDEINVAHFTDLARFVWVGMIPRPLDRRGGKFMAIPSAMELKKAGVRFESCECLLDMKFGRRCLFFWGVFQIPYTKLNLFSECMFGNIKALEQLGYEVAASHVTNFLFLLGCLVKSEEDLDLLMRQKIISNKLGDAAEVLKLLRRVCEGMSRFPEWDKWGACESLAALVGNYY